MATYKEIHGVKVQYRDSDATAIEGDVWYNASTGKLKMYASTGSWASGGNVNTARYGCGGGGTSEATWIASGYAPSVPGVTVNHEQYDGSSWTETTNVNTARNYIGSAGTATAALVVSGYLDPGFSVDTESWNGSAWTELANLNTSRYNGASFGTNTAAIYVSGLGPPSHAAVFVPKLAPLYLDVFRFANSVHADPFQDSVSTLKPGSKYPETTRAAVAVPALPI
jgi:hypothetical protein